MRKIGTVPLAAALATSASWVQATGDTAKHDRMGIRSSSSLGFDQSGARGATAAQAASQSRGSAAGSDASPVPGNAPAVAHVKVTDSSGRTVIDGLSDGPWM